VPSEVPVPVGPVTPVAASNSSPRGSVVPTPLMMSSP
jgi:hypothetical protein